MKIVILGAGRVGASVAENLVGEENDITVVDLNAENLKQLQDRLDLRTVCGHAAHPSTLSDAGADDADMLLAVTQSDETNMLACKLADTLFHVPTKIARIRSSDYLEHPEIFSPENFAVDHSICPEQLITDYIKKLVEFPEALQVLDFHQGRVKLVNVRAREGGLLVGKEIQYLRTHMPHVPTRVAAIFRKDHPLNIRGNTIVEPDDDVFLIAASEHIRMVFKELRREAQPVRRIMIAGGGNIGRRLAKQLEGKYYVKIIDHNPKTCARLSQELNHALVLHGDATDESLLETENIEEMDLFCALTNDDEDNIMGALLAKRMGAHRVISLINRKIYVDLVQGGSIDIALSPVQATIGSLLAHVRRGDMVAVHRLRRGAAEAFEVIVHGDKKNSKVVGRSVREINLPEQVTIGAIIRQSEVIIAHHDTIIESEDHLIIFLTDKKVIPKVERLFQVDIGFF